MRVYTVDELRAIVSTRAVFHEPISMGFAAETDTKRVEMLLLFQFWPQYRSYIAQPIICRPDGVYFTVAIQLPDEWYRYVKRELRKTFGVRHLHNVNKRDNSARIELLLGLQYI